MLVSTFIPFLHFSLSQAVSWDPSLVSFLSGITTRSYLLYNAWKITVSYILCDILFPISSWLQVELPVVFKLSYSTWTLFQTKLLYENDNILNRQQWSQSHQRQDKETRVHRHSYCSPSLHFTPKAEKWQFLRQYFRTVQLCRTQSSNHFYKEY